MMDKKKVEELLEGVRDGKTAVAVALACLQGWPSEQIGCAHIDHPRKDRTGVPEVIYGEHKTVEQIVNIAQRMLTKSYVVMVTRVDEEKATLVCSEIPELKYEKDARMILGNLNCIEEKKGRGKVLVLSAGTSDLSVAEEAYHTVACLGHEVERIYDVGVAGIHRLFSHKKSIDAATVLIVVAGMEGALPSVVAGLVDKPIVAVPTSIGYGTGFGGIAALLGMLNSCAPGVAVVNIDNGFGAACMAAAINARR